MKKIFAILLLFCALTTKSYASDWRLPTGIVVTSVGVGAGLLLGVLANAGGNNCNDNDDDGEDERKKNENCRERADQQEKNSRSEAVAMVAVGVAIGVPLIVFGARAPGKSEASEEKKDTRVYMPKLEVAFARINKSPAISFSMNL